MRGLCRRTRSGWDEDGGAGQRDPCRDSTRSGRSRTGNGVFRSRNEPELRPLPPCDVDQLVERQGGNHRGVANGLKVHVPAVLGAFEFDHHQVRVPVEARKVDASPSHARVANVVRFPAPDASGFDHAPPHFHALYGGQEAVIAIGNLSVLRGRLPARAHGLVVEWASLHRDDADGSLESSKEPGGASLAEMMRNRPRRGPSSRD